MWHSEARSEQPFTIEQRYFQRAVGIIDAGKVDPIQQSKVYHRFAQFASDQHAKIGNSGEVARLEGFVQRRSEELRQHDSMGRKGELNGHDANEVRRYRRLAEAILGQDKDALQTTRKRQMVFLEQAMVMFAKSFSTSDLFDNSFLRFFSLWFAHADNKDLNRKLESVLQSVPSHKFVLLTHQIVARLNKAVPGLSANDSDVSDTFSRLISDLTTRVCVDHPFHTLYALYAVRSDPALQEAPRRSSSKSTRGSQSSTNEHAPSQRRRAAAADEVWQLVFAQTKRLSQLKDLSLACDAYVEWAKFDLKAGGTRFYNKNGTLRKDLKLPSSAEIRLSSLHDLKAPIATVEIEIDKTCQYKNLVTIVRYSNSFSTAGGLHLPKITTCVGTDGQRHKQLVSSKLTLMQEAARSLTLTLCRSSKMKTICARMQSCSKSSVWSTDFWRTTPELVAGNYRFGHTLSDRLANNGACCNSSATPNQSANCSRTCTNSEPRTKYDCKRHCADQLSRADIGSPER